MSGQIRCNKDGKAISKKTGTCPKCGGIKCHIAIYWHDQLFRYYKDSNGAVFTYPTAQLQLANMNQEMRQPGIFKPAAWQHVAVKNRKLEQAITRWLEGIKKEAEQNELSFGTYYPYRSYVETHILHPEYGLGKWDIREIGYDELMDFKDALPSHLKIKTRREILNTLRTFLKSALQRLNRPLPPFPQIKGKDAKKRIALSLEDQATAINKIPLEHRDFYEFETETGTRPAETCALKISDFDFNAKTVTVQRTFTSYGKLREADKENHKGTPVATIPLSERAFEIAQRRARNRFPDDWLFVYSGRAKKVKHYTIQQLGKIWRKSTELPGVTHYEGTRHSFATQITEAAGDIYAAKDLLRHADIKSTQNYVHQRTEYLRTALARRTNLVDLNKAKEQKG